MKPKAPKNRKKGWKKVDTTELDDFIEDQRLQERTGGLVSDKTNEELFFIDEKSPGKPALPDSSIIGGYKKLKSFSNLEPDPRIPAISRHVKGHTKQNYLKSTKPLTRSQVKSLEQRKKDVSKRQQYLESDSKVPSSLKQKPSSLPAVAAPHPGSSYNPSFDDHQELLQKVVKKQVKEDLEERKLLKKTAANYGAEGPPTQESYLKEMSQGLGLNEGSDVESHTEEQDDTLTGSVNPPKAAQKMKTKKQKRKRKEMLQELANRKKEKQARILNDKNSNNRFRAIRKEIAVQEQQAEEKSRKKSLLLASDGLRTKRLNKKRYEEMEESVALTSELKGSMRLAKPSHSLLVDRFNSLQKRNVIEPRSRAKFRRKYKLKFAEKMPFKEITSSSRAGGGIIVPYHKKRHNEKV
ncbi:GLTSCR2 [Bugula neritina]|uniref:Ribosome biogenesis protein NOP53 n=1 Tax=Bugula neritina TaxID=10212 RepID=A0A7J7IUV5_BUGNE|nr:GLTSCR2 [Bugula neritina]